MSSPEVHSDETLHAPRAAGDPKVHCYAMDTVVVDGQDASGVGRAGEETSSRNNMTRVQKAEGVSNEISPHSRDTPDMNAGMPKEQIGIPVWAVVGVVLLTIGTLCLVAYGVFRAFALNSWWYTFLLVPFAVPNVVIAFLYTRSKHLWLRPIGRVVYVFPFGLISYAMLNFLFGSPLLLLQLIPTEHVEIDRVVFGALIAITVGFYIQSLIVALMPAKEYKYNIVLNNKRNVGENATAHRIKLIHISDLHMGCSVSGVTCMHLAKQVLKIVERESRHQQVAVLVTGDISDGDNFGFEQVGMKAWKKMLEGFAELDTDEDRALSRHRVQTLAILGNHDLYYPEEMQKLLSPAVVVYNYNSRLDHEYYTLKLDDNVVRVYGHCDYEGEGNFTRRLRSSSPSIGESTPFSAGITLNSENDIVVKEQPYIPSILMEHEPEKVSGYDLVLAGHTHAGQLFHFGLITKIAYPLFKGHYLQNETNYIVSRGTNWWGPRLRWLRREIGVITLEWRT